MPKQSNQIHGTRRQLLRPRLIVVFIVTILTATVIVWLGTIEFGDSASKEHSQQDARLMTARAGDKLRKHIAADHNWTCYDPIDNPDSPVKSVHCYLWRSSKNGDGKQPDRGELVLIYANSKHLASAHLSIHHNRSLGEVGDSDTRKVGAKMGDLLLDGHGNQLMKQPDTPINTKIAQGVDFGQYSDSISLVDTTATDDLGHLKGAELPSLGTTKAKLEDEAGFDCELVKNSLQCDRIRHGMRVSVYSQITAGMETSKPKFVEVSVVPHCEGHCRPSQHETDHMARKHGKPSTVRDGATVAANAAESADLIDQSGAKFLGHAADGKQGDFLDHHLVVEAKSGNEWLSTNDRFDILKVTIEQVDEGE